ncbi:MAG TPA: rhombosortase [Burkholderiaceae bacterium]|nr:rhombosortase [Burkholderiaceae bacterium]
MTSLGPGSRAWVALACAMAVGAILCWPLPPEWLQRLRWDPVYAWTQPWRWWTAAFVHLSPRHLVGNLAGAFVVGALGHAARVPLRCTLAWLCAWPLTHIALRLQPDLLFYGGLSGVLHAGAAIVACRLALEDPRRERLIGLAVLAGLAVKIAIEGPVGSAVRKMPDWDIPIVPLAHAAGFVAGVLCALASALPAGRPTR